MKKKLISNIEKKRLTKDGVERTPVSKENNKEPGGVDPTEEYLNERPNQNSVKTKKDSPKQ